MHSPHIVVFDSGVGGLSVAKEVLAAHPQCRLTYASDNQYFPYGSKSTEFLLQRVERLVDQLVAGEKPDLVVIACNTASTVTLPRLRERFSVPFVGVVPAIKPAASASQSRIIGMLATPATVARPYTAQLIHDHANHCRVLLHGSHELVRQAENKIQGFPVDQAAIALELSRLIDTPEAAEMDTIVLACTHFPLLRQELTLAAGSRRYQWVDSGEAIARRVGYWLEQFGTGNRPYTGAHQLVLTAPSSTWQALSTNLAAYLGDGKEFQLQVLQLAE